MTTATHATPGPWKVSVYDDGSGIGIFGENAYVAEVSPSAHRGYYNEADAHLIASAPELMDACLAAVGFLAGASILSKEQLQERLVAALKKAGVNQ